MFSLILLNILRFPLVVLKKLEFNLKSEIRSKHSSLTHSTKLSHHVNFYNLPYTYPAHVKKTSSQGGWYLSTESSSLNWRDMTLPPHVLLCWVPKGISVTSTWLRLQMLKQGCAYNISALTANGMQHTGKGKEERNGKAEWEQQQCVTWLHTGILSSYSKSFQMSVKISKISCSQGLGHAYH